MCVCVSRARLSLRAVLIPVPKAEADSTPPEMDQETAQVDEVDAVSGGTDIWHLVHAHNEFVPLHLMSGEEETLYVSSLCGALTEGSRRTRNEAAEALTTVAVMDVDPAVTASSGTHDNMCLVQAVDAGSSTSKDVANASGLPAVSTSPMTAEGHDKFERGEVGTKNGGDEEDLRPEMLSAVRGGEEVSPHEGGAQARMGMATEMRGKHEAFGDETKVLHGDLSLYVFMRLYQKMYERLKKAKDLAIAKDERKQRDRDEKETELSLQAGKQLHHALRADVAGASVNLPSEVEMKEADEGLSAEKEGASSVCGADAGHDAEEELLLSKAAEEDDDLCESYEVARLKGGGGGGGGRWGKKKGGGRWGKKGTAEEDDPVPEGASTYERFMHVLARLIKGSVDGSDFEESCRITLGTSSFELFTLDWLTRQLRLLAKSLVSVDLDSTPSSSAPFLALSEYHWVIRERERVKALQVGCDL